MAVRFLTHKDKKELENSVGCRVSYTEKQSLTEEEKATARENIGAIGKESAFTDAKYFDIDYDGLLSLKPEYRGQNTNTSFPYSISDAEGGKGGKAGSKNEELPEKLVIPEIIGDTVVRGFQDGAFCYNLRIKEIVFPDSVSELPLLLCANARYLETIGNTEHIKKLGRYAFMNTRIRKAVFPSLEEAEKGEFCQCPRLHTLDIGDRITALPAEFVKDCAKLSCVKGGASVKSIGADAFINTHNLKNLPLLKNVTSIGNTAFTSSRVQFDWSSLTNCTFGTRATPIADNTTDYWSGYTPAKCENRLGSLFNQRNPAWSEETFGGVGFKYSDGCSIFSIMHIHSALSGKEYASPVDFEADIAQNHPSLLTLDTRKSENVDDFFKGLGYSATYIASAITAADYKALCDALAGGAYVYLAKTTKSNADGGHAVVLYGVNEIGEVLVADSDTKTNAADLYDEGFTYHCPLQNISGPGSDIIIVSEG